MKRWPDPDTGLVRYTADPHEISLVDLPCVPDATFDVVKDGVAEKRAFARRPADDPADSDDLNDTDLDAENEKREFSTAERKKDGEGGVAMPDGSYPIRTAEDVENAIRDFNRSGKKPEVKAHIILRAKAIGAENALPDDWKDTADKAAARSAVPNAAPEALAKAAAALTHATLKLERAADENAGLRKALDDLSPALVDLRKRIAALEAQPLPAKAALRAIAKTQDGADDVLVSADDARQAPRLAAGSRARARADKAQPRSSNPAPRLNATPASNFQSPLSLKFRKSATPQRFVRTRGSLTPRRPARRRPKLVGPSPRSRRRSVNRTQLRPPRILRPLSEPRWTALENFVEA